MNKIINPNTGENAIQETFVPPPFAIELIEEKTKDIILHQLVCAMVNNDAKAADRALIQLMMEYDLTLKDFAHTDGKDKMNKNIKIAREAKANGLDWKQKLIEVNHLKTAKREEMSKRKLRKK